MGKRQRQTLLTQHAVCQRTSGARSTTPFRRSSPNPPTGVTPMEIELTELDPTLNRIRPNGRLVSPGVDSIELRLTASVASAPTSADSD
jgi:hypothetical protein